MSKSPGQPIASQTPGNYPVDPAWQSAFNNPTMAGPQPPTLNPAFDTGTYTPGTSVSDWSGLQAQYGANYGTAGYTPPPTAMATDPIGALYGHAQGAPISGSNPLDLTPAEFQQFSSAGSFRGDPNSYDQIMAYVSKFPASVQNQMKPGGAFWGAIHDPGWNPSWGGKGFITSGGANPWARTPEQLQAAGNDWMMNHMGSGGLSGPGLVGLQNEFAKWFNKNSLNGTGLSISAPAYHTPLPSSVARQMALAHSRSPAPQQPGQHPGIAPVPVEQTEAAPAWRRYNLPAWGTGNAENTSLRTILGL